MNIFLIFVNVVGNGRAAAAKTTIVTSVRFKESSSKIILR